MAGAFTGRGKRDHVRAPTTPRFARVILALFLRFVADLLAFSSYAVVLEAQLWGSPRPYALAPALLLPEGKSPFVLSVFSGKEDNAGRPEPGRATAWRKRSSDFPAA